MKPIHPVYSSVEVLDFTAEMTRLVIENKVQGSESVDALSLLLCKLMESLNMKEYTLSINDIPSLSIQLLQQGESNESLPANGNVS